MGTTLFLIWNIHKFFYIIYAVAYITYALLLQHYSSPLIHTCSVITTNNAGDDVEDGEEAVLKMETAK